ncbi:Retrovirus-related Pol polyprotein from transposon [Trichinella britovi]|uniref:Retrovirus-related Pol polyprotein from transposon n=1 Tax=Trichinella britovi TaxID=45882 RepID=A0A0V1C2T5_TRIBR|nr:Retrovirus-related Pol polyprotein from transposon [Trichinella britovi]
MLFHLQPNALTAITVDASGTAISAVLEPLINNNWQPLALFSRQLTDPERKCSAFDREILALYLPIRHIRCYIEDRHFIAFADHI